MADKIENRVGVKPIIPPEKIYRGGRKKGSKNKIQKDLKEDILKVFRRMGGVRAMLTWAKDNQTEFYTRVVPRMIPQTASITATVEQTVTHRFDLTKLTFEELADIQAKLSKARLTETVQETRN